MLWLPHTGYSPLLTTFRKPGWHPKNISSGPVPCPSNSHTNNFLVAPCCSLQLGLSACSGCSTVLSGEGVAGRDEHPTIREDKGVCRNVCLKEAEPHKAWEQAQLETMAPWRGWLALEMGETGKLVTSGQSETAQGTSEGKQDISGDPSGPVQLRAYVHKSEQRQVGPFLDSLLWGMEEPIH